MQILVFEFDTFTTLYNLNYVNDSLKFKEISKLKYFELKEYPEDTKCILIDETSPDEPKKSMVINTLLTSNFKITTNNVTNAIKRINSIGQIIEHLNREEYIRLSTPCIANVGMVKSYFKRHDQWDFNKFLLHNKEFYREYNTVKPLVHLESK